MKKTFVTTMPNHIGAFLKASECFALLGVNITRVSYNKAIDSHTLFIDAEGEEESLRLANERLKEIGYIQSHDKDERIVLLEFCLRDIPGSVTRVLKLINSFNFNISYISSQENGTEYQYFKMGLFVDDEDKIARFLDSARKICSVRVIDYDRTDKIFDNSIFYDTFVSGLVECAGLDGGARDSLLINANLLMQTLDERGLSFYKTFDSISRFAELLARYRGKNYNPRVSRHFITESTEIILIEPPCGSNTAIIVSGGEYLFIDSGYALYADESIALFRTLLEDFDSTKKRIAITHADLDHCGLLPLFDEVLASKKTADCLRFEFEGKEGYRETNPLHKPYIGICKTLTSYRPPAPDKVTAAWGTEEDATLLLTPIGKLNAGELRFSVYEGKGGHLKGETVFIDFSNRVAFTGDIFVNTHAFTAEQAEYNRYAPILMTSVDTDANLCAEERRAFFSLLSKGSWQIFGAHGHKKDIVIE